jgi:phage gp36-like protein
MYLTPKQLATHIGLQDLALIVSGRINEEIEDWLLVRGLEGELDDEPCAVVNAMMRINLALSSAEKMVNAVVSVRYPDGLTAQQIEDSPLPQLVAVMTKHDLMINTDEDTRLDYDRALKQLKMIAKGEMNLGVLDPSPSTSVSMSVGRSTSSFNLDGFGR